MIQPIKQNMTFGANSTAELYNNVTMTRKAPEPNIQDTIQIEENKDLNPQIEEKKNIGEKYNSAKYGLMNFFKGFNKIKDTTTGFTRGLVEGTIAASLVGVLGKNLKEHDGKFFASIAGSLKDIASEACKIIKNIPSVITKRPPLNTVTTIIKEPFKQAKKLKGNPWAIVAALSVGLGFVAYRTIEGRIIANQKNANLDHALEEGHIPTK